MPKIILVQRFYPLKIKTAQFSSRFRLHVFCKFHFEIKF